MTTIGTITAAAIVAPFVDEPLEFDIGELEDAVELGSEVWTAAARESDGEAVSTASPDGVELDTKLEVMRVAESDGVADAGTEAASTLLAMLTLMSPVPVHLPVADPSPLVNPIWQYLLNTPTACVACSEPSSQAVET